MIEPKIWLLSVVEKVTVCLRMNFGLYYIMLDSILARHRSLRMYNNKTEGTSKIFEENRTSSNKEKYCKCWYVNIDNSFV